MLKRSHSGLIFFLSEMRKDVSRLSLCFPFPPPPLIFSFLFLFGNGPRIGHLLLLVGLCLQLQVQVLLDFSLRPHGGIVSYSQHSEGLISVFPCESLSPLILRNRWGYSGCISHCRIWTSPKVCRQLIYPWIPHSTVCPLSSSLKMCLRSTLSDTLVRLPQINWWAVLKPVQISVCGLHSREMRVTCIGDDRSFYSGSGQCGCCSVEQCPAHGKTCAKCTAPLDKMYRKPVSQGEPGWGVASSDIRRPH